MHLCPRPYAVLWQNALPPPPSLHEVIYVWPQSNICKRCHTSASYLIAFIVQVPTYSLNLNTRLACYSNAENRSGVQIIWYSNSDNKISGLNFGCQFEHHFNLFNQPDKHSFNNQFLLACFIFVLLINVTVFLMQIIL